MGEPETKRPLVRPGFIRALIWSPILAFVVILFEPVLRLLTQPQTSVARATGTAYSLKNSISTYFTDHRKYPLVAEGIDQSMNSGHPLISILVGIEDASLQEYNPNGIAYFSSRWAKPVRGKLIGGVEITEDERWILWDPWGNQYRVRMDSNLDHQIASPENPEQLLPESIAVWSAGPDGDFSTWKDNVKTW